MENHSRAHARARESTRPAGPGDSQISSGGQRKMRRAKLVRQKRSRRNAAGLRRWLAVAVCVSGATPGPLTAAISDEDFNALKELVIKQGQRIDQLEQAHNKDLDKLRGDQKVHEQDQQEIQQLKLRLDETQKTAVDAQQRASAAAQ